MIVPMLKLYIAVRLKERKGLLSALRHAGSVHLEPADPSDMTFDDETVSVARRLKKAGKILETLSASGSSPNLSPIDAADRVIRIAARIEESMARLGALRKEAGNLSRWGDIRIKDLEFLNSNGVEIRFFSVPNENSDRFRAECVIDLGVAKSGKRFIALVYRTGTDPRIPESAEVVEPPVRDRPSVLREILEVKQTLEKSRVELAGLAVMAPEVRRASLEIREKSEWVKAEQGALFIEDLFVVRGWIPGDRVEELDAVLKEFDIKAAYKAVPPADTDMPPTLVEYSKWTRPISGLFEILGTTPGYREIDVAGAFIIVLPLFAAILIADGGYGLIMMLAPAIAYRPIAARFGDAFVRLVMIIGVCSLLWGVVISSFFGVSSAQLSNSGGLLGRVGEILGALQLVGEPFSSEMVVRGLMRLSFILGAVHMSGARIWRAFRLFPDTRFLSHAGRALFLWGMLLAVNTLVLEDPPHFAMLYLFCGGGLLAILFEHPGEKWFRRIWLGLAFFPLTVMGTLSDTISYIRLMAVGLASAILAATFNGLAVQTAQSATWFVGIPVLIFGHGLNICLAFIALFAHGVRLNILEFSSHLGMAWSGYPYSPFRGSKVKEA